MLYMSYVSLLFIARPLYSIFTESNFNWSLNFHFDLHLAMLLLVALAVVAVTAARASPSIEAVGNDILISVGDGSNVSIATWVNLG